MLTQTDVTICLYYEFIVPFRGGDLWHMQIKLMFLKHLLPLKVNLLDWRFVLHIVTMDPFTRIVLLR